MTRTIESVAAGLAAATTLFFLLIGLEVSAGMLALVLVCVGTVALSMLAAALAHEATSALRRKPASRRDAADRWPPPPESPPPVRRRAFALSGEFSEPPCRTY
jgi:hypothetical protein